MKTATDRCLAVIGVLGACAAFSMCLWWYIVDFSPRQDFERIIAGNSNIGLEAVEVDVYINGNLDRIIYIDDPDSMQYLTQGLSRAKIGKYQAGAYYEATIYFSSGRSARCGLDISIDGNYLTLNFPLDSISIPFDSMKNYVIPLTGLIPKPLAELLAWLRSRVK